MIRPVESMVVVPVLPKYAYPADSCVDDACPLKSSSDVVADCPAAGCVNGSTVAVRNPASFVSCDVLIDEVANEYV